MQKINNFIHIIFFVSLVCLMCILCVFIFPILPFCRWLFEKWERKKHLKEMRNNLKTYKEGELPIFDEGWTWGR